MNSYYAAKRVVRVLDQRLPMSSIYGPSRRIPGAWVPRETKGTYDHGIAVVVDSGLDPEWVLCQVTEIFKAIRREPSLRRTKLGLHIWYGDKVSTRYREAETWKEDLMTIDPAKIRDSSLKVLADFASGCGADQVIVLTKIVTLLDSDERKFLSGRRLSVVYPAGQGERDTYRIKDIPCFGV